MKVKRERNGGDPFSGRAAIVANGSLTAKTLPQALLERYEYVIGCDGGGRFLYEIGVFPHLLVGDFDSMNPELFRFFLESGKTEIAEFPPEKDFTDLELAAEFAIQRGYSHLDLYGATGSRLDHTLGNMMMLYQIRRMGGVGTIIDENNIVFAGEGRMEISRSWAEAVFRRTAPGITGTRWGVSGDFLDFEGEGDKGAEGEERNGLEPFFISLLLLTDCHGITLEGFRYPLTNENGVYGSSRCISNELLEQRGRIRFEKGRMLVFISRD